MSHKIDFGKRKEILSSIFLQYEGEYIFVPGIEYKQTLNQQPAPATTIGYPHDHEALASFYSIFPPTPKVIYKETLWKDNIPKTSKVISTGSPKSSAQARQLLPFYEISLNDRKISNQPIIKPESIEYWFGENISDPMVKVVSKMENPTILEKSRKVLIAKTGGIRYNWHPPGYEKDGWLAKDFLLVSHLPRNEKGGEILMLSGGHGAGTEATRLLFSDLSPDDLKYLETFTKKTQYYQFVIEIDDIGHPSTGTIPLRIHLSEKLPPIELKPEFTDEYLAARKIKRKPKDVKL